MPKVKKERVGAAKRKQTAVSTQVRQSITFNKDFGQHILKVGLVTCVIL